MSGERGVVYSTTTVHDRDGAYNVCLVDLEDGGRMMSTVVGVAPDDVRIGMAVRACDNGARSAERRGRAGQPHGQLAAHRARLLPRHRRRRRAARDRHRAGARAASPAGRAARRRRGALAALARARVTPDITTTAATESAGRAYAMAGLGPADVDVVEVYDAFTISTILFLEDLGFCAKGEGGPFVAHANGGALAAQATAILGTLATV